MKTWVIYAFLGMAFSGIVPVLDKAAMGGVSSQVALTLRTLFVGGFVVIFACAFTSAKDFAALSWRNILCLGFSALATALAWTFQYKALKMTNVGNVGLIDKGSIIVAIALAAIFLGETISWRMAIGCVLVVSGLITIAYR